MKIKVTEQELNECITSAVKRVLSEGKDKRHDKSKKDIEIGFDKPIRKPRKKAEDDWRKELKDVNDDRIAVCEDSYFDDGVYDIEYTTFKTDIDRVETSLLDDIKNKFSPEEVEEDVVDGLIAFNVTKGLENEFVDFLNQNDVNIIE